ncbi:hypothetical protein QA612_06515 [Evansella sp. AB-P1]|uniref:hypothetical protein n=1 Tax=Evansella sp. AB-P1 TaxID=3037653 RepID=UPI00241DC1CC|nr:hypothetical protein [Evansella sp. AB-P1]MDG5787140.1 hypothetical protein [Evansella sp. AB-P1]
MDTMKKVKKTRLYVGIALTFFGLIGMSAEIESISEDGLSQGLIGILFVAIPIIAVGLYLVLKHFKDVKKIKNEYLERTVLRIVKEHNGIITVTDLAADSDLSITESETVLEDFAMKGYAVRKLTDQGATVYDFKTVLSSVQKEQAKSIYDY